MLIVHDNLRHWQPTTAEKKDNTALYEITALQRQLLQKDTKKGLKRYCKKQTGW